MDRSRERLNRSYKANRHCYGRIYCTYEFHKKVSYYMSTCTDGSCWDPPLSLLCNRAFCIYVSCKIFICYRGAHSWKFRLNDNQFFCFLSHNYRFKEFKSRMESIHQYDKSKSICVNHKLTSWRKWYHKLGQVLSMTFFVSWWEIQSYLIHRDKSKWTLGPTHMDHSFLRDITFCSGDFRKSKFCCICFRMKS